MDALNGTEEVYSGRSNGLEATDDDGAVCRSAVELVSVKTKQWFALIRKPSNAILHIVLLLMCIFAAHTPGYTTPTQYHHDPPEFSDTCRWCRCPTPEQKEEALRPQMKRTSFAIGSIFSLSLKDSRFVLKLP